MYQIPEVAIKLDRQPKISVIILTKNNTDKLFKCLDSIFRQNYSNLEIIIGDTGTSYDEKIKIKKYFENYLFETVGKEGYAVTYRHTLTQIKVTITYAMSYHFSKNNNYLADMLASEDSEYLLFSNNDIELLNNVIEQMMFAHLSFPYQIGTVGCQMFYPTSTIQHQGIKVVELHSGYQYNKPQYAVGHTNLGTTQYDYEPKFVFGNTGAFLLVKKDVFESIGGFREDCQSVFQDVILNIEMLRRGMKNFCVLSAVAIHDESSTRRKDIKDNQKLQADLVNVLNPYIKENLEFVKPYLEKAYII